jgi:hypothetical protein
LQEREARQSMHACLPRPVPAQQAGNGSGGLEWVQKGGGYHSECNRRQSR